MHGIFAAGVIWSELVVVCVVCVNEGRWRVVLLCIRDAGEGGRVSKFLNHGIGVHAGSDGLLYGCGLLVGMALLEGLI